MKDRYDIVVVGAGPAGSLAAKHAALGGADVLLIEKKAEIGAPLRCAEGVSKRRLREVGIEPDPGWISSEIRGTIMRTVGGSRLKVDESWKDGEVGYVLDRHLFDKFVAGQAAEAGAEVTVRAACTGVIRDGSGRISGVKVSYMGETREIGCDCIVAADGFESQVARWAGIDTSLELKDIDSCIQYTMTGVDIEPDYCEFVLGSVSPGGYAWIFPKGKDSANVGLGILGTKIEPGRTPKYYLDRFVESEPGLRSGAIVNVAAGMVSLCPGLESAAEDGIVLVGDAARVIDPMTGGGIYHALMTGMHAGDTLAGCYAKKDYSKGALAPYEEIWRGKILKELQRNWKIKERFVDMEDGMLDHMIDVASHADMEKVRVDDMVRVVKERCPDIVSLYR
ncbi:MAG: geranylgeranyl reductase family protein [Candidatus Methanomethylophilaceae archaeon]